MTYEKIKQYYEEGRWTKTMVRKAVERGVITPIQYEEIVHEPY